MLMLTQRHSDLNWPVHDQRLTPSVTSASREVAREEATRDMRWPIRSGFWQRLESLKKTAEEQLTQRPAVAIAAGIALGVVIGWLLKRR